MFVIKINIVNRSGPLHINTRNTYKSFRPLLIRINRHLINLSKLAKISLCFSKNVKRTRIQYWSCENRFKNRSDERNISFSYFNKRVILTFDINNAICSRGTDGTWQTSCSYELSSALDTRIHTRCWLGGAQCWFRSRGKALVDRRLSFIRIMYIICALEVAWVICDVGRIARRKSTATLSLMGALRWRLVFFFLSKFSFLRHLLSRLVIYEDSGIRQKRAAPLTLYTLEPPILRKRKKRTSRPLRRGPRIYFVRYNRVYDTMWCFSRKEKRPANVTCNIITTWKSRSIKKWNK